MSPDPAAEARLFARLSLKGILTKQQVAELFAQAQERGRDGDPVSLSALAVEAGLIDEHRLARLFRSDGDEVPRLPGFALVSKLGEGGTAGVYRVRDAEGEDAAVKILHAAVAADPAEVQAFVAEARLLQRLEHENVVKGDRVGRIDGRYLFFMECVEGRTLQEAIAEGGAFDEDGALLVILQVARALEYLREEGVVHRDVKPGNIMVTADNAVKLIDLGFAGETQDEAGAEGGSARGTAAFLSPEQARGQADLDVRSDIYSLGATLYQMVLGELPFQGDDDEELVQQAVLAGLSAAATKSGRISAHMHYFIEKMMAKDRDIRYQDPRQLMTDIENQIRGKKSLDVESEETGGDEAERARRKLDRMRRKRKRKR